MKSEKSSSRPKGSGGLPNATSATLRTVAANPPRSWTVRIIKPVFYAFILLLAARFTVVYLLPKNRFLFREFTFQANDSESHSHQSRLWDHFGQHQENIILELAQNSSPTLSRELIVNSSHFHPDKLVIRISCPYRDEKLAEGFRRLIIDYTKQRSLIEAEWAADNRQTQTKSETLTPDQIRQSEEYNRRLQELILLQSEYARIDAQSVAYEHQLSPAKSANEPIGFSEFIKPYVQNALAFDDQWCHLNQWLNKLRRQRAELDIKCGQCDSAEQLEKLLQQREQIELRYNQEKRNLNQRRELIADMVRLECRGRYQEQLKTKIQESQLALIANSDQQLVLKMEIDCLKNHSDHPKPSPAPPANPTNTIKNSSHSSEDTDTNADTNITVSSRNIEFRPRFIKTAKLYKTRETLSPPQYLIMASAALLGAALGWFIGPGRSVKKTNGNNSLIEPQEEQPEQQADNESDEKTAQEKSEVQEKPEEQEAPTDWSSQFRHLAETVERFRQQVDSPVILLAASESDIVSPRAAVNLSIVVARSSLKVLLVEADLERNDLAVVFELPEAPGFYEWRRGEIWASNAITPTTLTGLSFMHSGSPSPEQCNSEVDLNKESHRWNNLRRNYDVIVIYCPAALSVPSESSSAEQFASTTLLDLADGVFVLTRTARSAEGPATPQIETLLEGHRAQFLGSITINV